MRRALRDKLRSTESLNIDLEREVRRRTEVVEQRNVELREALERLRRAQDDLVRSEKLASMGRLVAGIAHEINNPVNAVINTIGPLAEAIRSLRQARDPGALEAIGDDAEEMLGVIQRGATRTKSIVQALHNYSRGDDEQPREVNLARSVEDTLDLLRHRLKDIRIEKQVDPALRVVGFAGQIDQVLMNLVTNAAQAIGARPGGRNDPHPCRRGQRRRHDRVDRHRRWSRNSPGAPAAHLRSVLHHQGRGGGIRAGAVDRSRHHRPSRRQDLRRQRRGRGDDVQDPSAETRHCFARRAKASVSRGYPHPVVPQRGEHGTHRRSDREA